MSYLVLARKFRPQTFESIRGQEHVSLALSNAITRDRVPHALLFTGPRGVGKTTAARVFAKALNCSGREVSNSTAEPCLECSNCTEIAASSNMAVWEVDGASNNSVDNVRSLIESLQSAPPPGSKYKIYIIDEVHMLSNAAFNALLKSLEEPPPNTVFIFATTEPHKIPETVISRCQTYDFRKLSDELILKQLKEISAEEGVEVEEEVFKLIASRARGGMRDAQSLFDRLLSYSSDKIDASLAREAFGAVEQGFFFELSEAVLESDSGRAMELVDRVFLHSLDIKSFLDDFVSHWRTLVMTSLGSGPANYQAVCQGKEGFDFARLFALAEEICSKALISSYPRYAFEAGVLKMASLPSLRPLAELISAVESGQPLAPIQASKGLARMPEPEKARPEKKNLKSPENSDSEEVAATPMSSSFNPSWVEFVTFVKNRKEMVLAAYLRRVQMVSFSDGRLTLAATQFDREALGGAATKESLLSCLETYSGQSEWSLDFQDLAKAEVPTKKTPPSSDGAPGSIAAEEVREKKERVLKIEAEAKEQVAVKEALKSFSGSKVERVIVLED